MEELTKRIEELERNMKEHERIGVNDYRVNFSDIFGKLEIVSTVPIGSPNNISEQIKIYTNGVTYRLYWYDTTAGFWRYATGT